MLTRLIAARKGKASGEAQQDSKIDGRKEFSGKAQRNSLKLRC